MKYFHVLNIHGLILHFFLSWWKSYGNINVFNFQQIFISISTIYGYLCTPTKPMPSFKGCLCVGQVVIALIAIGCLCTGQVVMELIIILAKLEQDSLFTEASQLYSDLKFYFVLQICWVRVKGYHV